MTGLTFRGDVSSSQRIAGVNVVIEGDGLPVALRVAGVTFLAVGSFVCVVPFVTGVAIDRRILKRRGLVTFLTLHSGVLP